MRRRLGRHESVRRVLRPFVTVPPDRTWVFVLGCYNSGTSLLHDLVAASRRCARLPSEGVPLTSELISPEDLGWTWMWWKVYDQMKAFGRGGGGDPLVVKRDWCIWYDTSRPVFLEKSISNAVRIRWIEDSFHQPRYLYIVRNGYAVAEGIRRHAGRGRYPLPQGLREYPIAWCARQWVESSKVIDAGLALVDVGRVLRVRYEDLCADPGGWAARLGTFLGLDDLADKDLRHVSDRNADAIARLTADDILTINGVAAGELARHRYEVLRPDGPSQRR